MTKTIKLFLLTAIILLGACQQNPKLTQTVDSNTNSDVAEILKIITVEAIKEQDFLQAQRSITALILSNDNSAWEFIYSAIITLPQEMGLEIIEGSLAMDSVKNSSEQLFGIAKTYISYKDYEKAMELINKSIALNDKNLDARFWRARLLTILKQYDQAKLDFDYLIKNAPQNYEYANQYASFLQETKQYIQAQDLLAKQEPNIENLFRRVIFNLQANNIEPANNLYQGLKNFEVDETLSNRKNFLVAEAGYFLEKPEESLSYYKKVLGGDSYLDAREMMSLILYETEKYDEAKEVLHQLQNAEEKYAVKAYRLESQINKLQNDPEAAMDTLNRSLELLPNNAILLYDRAMLNESMGKMDLVEEDLLQILEDDPESADALNALGYSLADNDLKLNKALEYIQKALELSPNNPAIIDSLGWVQYKLGEYDKAEINLRRAINTEIQDPELYYHLYRTLLKLEKKQEAQELLKKAQGLFPDYEKFFDN
ncbi:MAG: CDC27 family protein [Marinicellaceae bacterium]